MARYAFTAPYPPSVNRIWRRAGHVTYKTREAKAYTDALQGAFLQCYGAMPSRLLEGPLKIEFRAYRKTKRGDLDNIFKVLGDSMNGFIYEDDSQIVEIHAYRYDAAKVKGVKTAGYVEIVIEEIEGEMNKTKQQTGYLFTTPAATHNNKLIVGVVTPADDGFKVALTVDGVQTSYGVWGDYSHACNNAQAWVDKYVSSNGRLK
jgi:Holliday junction resolvase RusA-like endonuclease